MMRNLLSTVGAVCLLAACAPEMAWTTESPGAASAEPLRSSAPVPNFVPAVDIPVLLRGCWDWSPPADPEEPGSPHRLIITATTITETGPGLPERIATAEHVTRVTPTSIEGLFSAPDGNGRATVATALMLGDGGDNGPVNQLRRAEGDAGSAFYDRCPS